MRTRKYRMLLRHDLEQGLTKTEIADIAHEPPDGLILYRYRTACAVACARFGAPSGYIRSEAARAHASRPKWPLMEPCFHKR